MGDEVKKQQQALDQKTRPLIWRQIKRKLVEA